MSNLKNIRENPGSNQQQMAQWLGGTNRGLTQQQAIEHIVKIEKLQNQLALLRKKHAALQQQRSMAKNLMDNAPTEKEMLFFKMAYYVTSCKLTKYDEAKQLSLEAKILGLQREYEQLTES